MVTMQPMMMVATMQARQLMAIQKMMQLLERRQERRRRLKKRRRVKKKQKIRIISIQLTPSGRPAKNAVLIGSQKNLMRKQ